jgi:hypothetical protein
MKEVSVSFAVYYTPAEFSKVIAAFSDGLIAPAPLVSRVLSLPDLNDAFDDLARAAGGPKTLIRPLPATPASQAAAMRMNVESWLSLLINGRLSR